MLQGSARGVGSSLGEIEEGGRRPGKIPEVNREDGKEGQEKRWFAHLGGSEDRYIREESRGSEFSLCSERM